MNILFTNAVLWPVLFLVAVPLLLHLFARTRPPVYKFSSVEFIRKIIRATMRVKRPQDWILLFLRTVLFAALAFMFLRPLLFSHKRLAGHFQKKSVVVIVDATASMAYIDGGQTRFASACAEASEILSGLSARDRANIIWLTASPSSVFPEIGMNLAFLKNSLRRAKVTSEAGSIEEAINAAIHMLEGQEGKREICVLSDFQKTAWENVDRSVPHDIDLINVRIGSDAGQNIAITDIYCDPARPLIGEECTIYCETYNYSSQPRRTSLFLNTQESRHSQDLMIPSWSKNISIFHHKFGSPGNYPITASLGEDSFSDDDQRWKTIEVSEFLSVGILPDEPVTADIWKRALDALGWARTETLTATDLDSPLSFDIIMLAGWKGTGTGNLRNALASGTTIVSFPAAGVDTAKAQLATNTVTPVAAMRWDQPDSPLALAVVKEDDIVFRLFAGGDYGDPARGTFRGRLTFPPAAMSQGDTLLKYSDNIPALVRFKNNGNLFVWNISLDPQFSSWAKQVEFLPFLAELLLSGRIKPDLKKDLMDFLPGQQINRKFDRELLARDLALVNQDGIDHEIRELKSDSGSYFISDNVSWPGLYSWKHQDVILGYSVVNFPLVESDLRAMTLEEVERPGSITVAGGSKVRQLRDGLKLWPYLLFVALVAALMEGGILLWVEKR